MRASICSLTGAIVVASSLAAQPPAPRVLAKPVAEFAEPFSDITSIRELRDGRLIVTDRREKTVQLVDFASGKATPIGHEGAGPGEFGLPTRLFAVGDDVTLLWDPVNARGLYILAGGKPGVTFVPELADGTRVDDSPFAVDAKGAFYYRDTQWGAGGRGIEVARVLRLVNHARRPDTLASLAVPKGEDVVTSSLPNGLLRTFTNLPMAPIDLAAVAPDGRVAIVRHADYHVEWIAPDGAVTRGPPQKYSPIKVSDAEKSAFLKTLIRPGTILTSASPSAGTGSAAPRTVARIPPEFRAMFDEKNMTWPATVPPFLAGAATVAPDGTLWVLRTRPVDDPTPTFDLFDARGQLTARVAIPKDTKLVGFGRGTVYLARKDNDDLLYLQRYSMPK